MTADTVGGVWTFALDLVEQLGSRNVEVMLATMGPEPSPGQLEEASAIRNLRLAPSRYKLEWMDDPWEDIEASGAWLRELEQEFAPDLIHLNSFGHGSLQFRAPVLLTAHSCVVSWWSAVKRNPLPRPWNHYRLHVEMSIKGADLLTAPSRAMLAAITEIYGPDLPPARVVPNGRRAEQFYAAAKEPLILAAGRLWDEGKNIAALAEIADSLPWPVYLAGEDRSPDRTSVRTDGCRALGLLAPAVLADWYARAAIYVLPARYEPFGLSVLEAAFSECTLVLGDIASLREIWGDAALFVPPDDTNQLADALRLLVERPDIRQEMARRSRARAQEFTADRMAETYAELYDSLAGMRRIACAS
jgi:glycosyltransferase involved in cell wall biosynthesis